MAKTILSCTDVSMIFHEGGVATPVLNAVSLSISAGEQIAIVGTSGSGKSTLLHLLGGLALPTVGKVSLHQQDYAVLSANARARLRNQHLGFVYQFHHLLPEFSAVENVAMPLLIRGEGTRAAKKAATAILDEVGLSHRLRHKPSQLSGGERQRVAIARAVITEPDCILADEPTGNLDSQSAANVMALLADLNRQRDMAVVMVTHDRALAATMPQQWHMQDGQIQQQEEVNV